MTLASLRSQRRRPAGRQPIGLALQGGGSWGAYTWGVLDSVLARPRLAVTQLSGSSAGAINAAIVASALAKGSAQQAREALASFWRAMAQPAGAEILRSMMGPLGRHWSNSIGEWLIATSALTMPSIQTLADHPLRDAVTRHVDIDAIRSNTAPALFVTLTNVRTGLPRVISNEAMSIDALLASACLPYVFPAVQLDGEHYWDGGYAGNPTLWPMVRSGLAGDLLLVQLVPERIEVLPASRASIRRRVGEIVFNASLVAEMRALLAIRELSVGSQLQAAMAATRLHRVGPPRAELLEAGSGIDRGPAWLARLHDEGMTAGRRFLASHAADLGVRETLDVARLFRDAHDPRVSVPTAPVA